AIDPTLAGDIEIIVATAMDRDRARRYQSAAEFGADVQRYLRSQPIVARQGSQLYIVGKLVRRHRNLLIAASAAMLVLSTLGVYAAIKARQNYALAKLANQHAADLEKTLYLNRIGFAHAAFLAHESARMRRLLDEC